MAWLGFLACWVPLLIRDGKQRGAGYVMAVVAWLVFAAYGVYFREGESGIAVPLTGIGGALIYGFFTRGGRQPLLAWETPQDEEDDNRPLTRGEQIGHTVVWVLLAALFASVLWWTR